MALNAARPASPGPRTRRQPAPRARRVRTRGEASPGVSISGTRLGNAAHLKPRRVARGHWPIGHRSGAILGATGEQREPRCSGRRDAATRLLARRVTRCSEWRAVLAAKSFAPTGRSRAPRRREDQRRQARQGEPPTVGTAPADEDRSSRRKVSGPMRPPVRTTRNARRLSGARFRKAVGRHRKALNGVRLRLGQNFLFAVRQSRARPNRTGYACWSGVCPSI